jgi:GNAT superfamily N-acetyltransferase
MIDRWFPHVTFPVARETFRQLPRNPTYKYEYFDGEAQLSPRPKSYHCLLELAPRDVPEAVELQGGEQATFRPLAREDWPRFPKLFAAAFDRLPPFGLIAEKRREEAARECLNRTRSGGDGPVVEQASFVAQQGDQLLGAVLITLMYAGDLETYDDPGWSEPAPPDALKRRWGRPHLTWIFVAPLSARHGIGAALLGRAVNELHRLGYRQLASTFLLGNESSTLWHWKNGFRLLSFIASPGAITRAVRRATAQHKRGRAGTKKAARKGKQKARKTHRR